MPFPDELSLSSDDLTQIRQNADWRSLFSTLGIQSDPKKSKPDDWWGKSPFKPDERTASFHINDQGWFCHSSGQGGGVIELVQALHPDMNCYEAGRWLIDRGISSISTETKAQLQRTAPQILENQPIRQDLRSQLCTDHPHFAERGITPEVLEELGAGYLDRPARKNGRSDPMNHRLVFQIRGIRESASGVLEPVVLGHIGRATTEAQATKHGKWWTYQGFRKSLEIYNLGLVMHDDEALAQATDTGDVILVEGCFDVAKLYSAGIRNAVASLGARLNDSQVDKLDLLSEITGCDRFQVWYDRDQDGVQPNGMGAMEAVDLLTARGFEVSHFDWNQTFSSSSRSKVAIPSHIKDPCDFSIEQLQWLRREGWI